MVSEFPAKSEKLKSLQVRLHNKEHDAQKNMHRLGRLTWLANIRRNGIMFLLYLIFEFLFFWDVHCLDLLEKWKQRNGQYVRGWFDDLGQWEALCALAKLAGDEPEWNFPAGGRIARLRTPSLVANNWGIRCWTGTVFATTCRSDLRERSCWSPVPTCRQKHVAP